MKKPASKKKLLKPTANGSITITNNFQPDRIQIRLINKLYQKVLSSKHKKSYDNSYKTQKYDLKYIITKIIYFLHKCSNWRALGDGWENIYAHFQRWIKWGIIDSVFEGLCGQYKEKREGGHLKLLMTDTTIITNKYGTDCIKRNPLVKNKNCSKLINLVDDKGVTLFVDFCPGTSSDSKRLMTFLDKYLSDNVGITTFLADSGFYTNEIMETLKKHEVKPLIAKNVRNTGTRKKLNKNKKKVKLTYEQKIKRQLEDMTVKEKKLFKKRHKVENGYASYKQIPRFTVRYDKHILSLKYLSLFYFCEQLIKHL